jgi:hypothetical protein
MFMTLIAVVVVLLLIIGYMSQSTTSGSGGVDQTKAAKMVTEMGALAQSASFYKTMTTDADYKDVSVAQLKDAGIVDALDLVDVTTIDNLTGDSAVPAAGDVIKSKAINGLYYIVKEGSNDKYLVIESFVDTDDIADDSSLAKAMDKALEKFNVDGDASDSTINATDGNVTIVATDADGKIAKNSAAAVLSTKDGAGTVVFR